MKNAIFEKVSLEEFIKDFDTNDKDLYDKILLPKRATKGSAGYDFFAPFNFTLNPGETMTIPTGIRCKMNENLVLLILPRSGLGFKYKMQLYNTVGVIDSDYYYSQNEGHIFIKITNDNNENKTLKVKQGKAFAQGIFLNYFITDNDDTEEKRNGGFGSTDK